MKYIVEIESWLSFNNSLKTGNIMYGKRKCRKLTRLCSVNIVTLHPR